VTRATWVGSPRVPFGKGHEYAKSQTLTARPARGTILAVSDPLRDIRARIESASPTRIQIELEVLTQFCQQPRTHAELEQAAVLADEIGRRAGGSVPQRSAALAAAIRQLIAQHWPMVCPHCQVRGHVHTEQISRNAGISGAKATGALLTGGISMLATGLSQKQHVTKSHCSYCGATWTF